MSMRSWLTFNGIEVIPYVSRLHGGYRAGAGVAEDEWGSTWSSCTQEYERGSDEQGKDRTNRNQGHVGRARTGAGQATSGIAAFPELRVSVLGKQGIYGFMRTRTTQPRQKKTKTRNLLN